MTGYLLLPFNAIAAGRNTHKPSPKDTLGDIVQGVPYSLLDYLLKVTTADRAVITEHRVSVCAVGCGERELENNDSYTDQHQSGSLSSHYTIIPFLLYFSLPPLSIYLSPSLYINVSFSLSMIIVSLYI